MTKQINSDYSEFISDRFMNFENPKDFFDHLINQMQIPMFKKQIYELKNSIYVDYPNYPGEDPIKNQHFAICNVISFYLCDIFGLQKHFNDDLLAPGCLFYEEYKDCKESDEVPETLRKILFNK